MLCKGDDVVAPQGRVRKEGSCLRQELSFRIRKEGSERFSDSCRRAKKPPPELFARTTELIHQGRTEELLEHDQLRSACARGEAFIGFLEPGITFRPTFKVKRQVGVDYNNQRRTAIGCCGSRRRIWL